MELRPGFNQTEAGTIPADWHAPRVASVCRLINGRGFRPFEWRATGLPIIRIQNLNGSDDYNHFGGTYDPKLEVRRGQLLFAWSGSRGTSFGPHIWRGRIGLLNYHTWKIDIPEGGVAKSFLFHALKGLTSYIEGKAHGAAALVHVQKGEMESFRVPVPHSTVEQERIAAALNDADALIKSLEQLLAKKRHLRQGAMQELLTGKKRLPGFSNGVGYRRTDVGRLPADWRVAPLSTLLTNGPTNGWSGRSTTAGSGIPTLSLSATTPGRLVLTDQTVKYLQGALPRGKDCYLLPGDVLVQRSNTAELVGTTAVYDGPPRTYVYPDLMMRLRFREPTTARWFWRYANSAAGRSFFQRTAAGSTGTMPKISGALLRTMTIPMPESGEQEAIVKVVDDMEAEIDALEARLTKARQIKRGMMQELLTGRIRLV